MGKCKYNECKEIVEGSHCEPHRVLFLAAEKARGANSRRKPWNDDRCQRCFQSGHDEDKCKWVPSIYANAETPEQAAKRVGR